MRVELLTDVADSGATVYVLVRLQADAPPKAKRNPVNLALAIDRSSSMRGPRLAQALRAAALVVEQLQEHDRLSVIAFDASARIVFGPAVVSESAKPVLLGALAEIETGVGTNLAAGIRKGAEAIRSGFVRDAVSRLVLLTDGQPSVGVLDGERLGALVAVENQRGVTTTTMGLGEGFDDELLSHLARQGKGGFYYLASPADISAAFGRELAGVFAIAATQVELKLIPGVDVNTVEVMHRLSSRPLDDGLLVEVGELATGEPRQILFRLTRSADATNDRCGTLAVSFRQPDGAAGDGHLLGVQVPSAPIGQHVREVTLERLRLTAATAVDVVWARRASGDRAHALAALGEVRKAVLDAKKRKLADPAELEQLLEDMAEAENAVARSAAERERARRTMRERSHITLLGQSTVRRLPTDDE